MIEILTIVIPVFLILGAGYISVRLGYLNGGISENLNAFAVKFAVPVLLFKAMLKLDLVYAVHVGMLTSFYVGAVFSFFCMIVLARVVWQRKPGEAVAVGFCALFSNTVLLGIPIFHRAYGEGSSEPVFGILIFHAASLFSLGFITMEFSRRDGRSLKDTLVAVIRSTLRNPFMIGVLCGLFVNVTRLPIPEPVMAAATMIAAAGIPVALFGIGAALTRYSLKEEISESLAVSVFSLVVHPAVAFILSYFVFDLPKEYIRAAVIIAAMPPGINAFVFASMYNRAMSLAASTVLISTVLSIFTITLWLSLLQRLGL